LLSGCYGPEPQDHGPTLSVSRSSSSGDPAILPGKTFSSFNFTGCHGGVFATRVPAELVDGMLPSGYEYSQEIAGLVLLRVDLVSCEKVADNGVDIGPGSAAFVSSPLERAGDHQGGEATWWWVHEVSASLPQVGAQLDSNGTGINAVHSSSFDASMPYAAQLTAEATHEGNTLMSFTGTPYTAMNRVGQTRMLFFGEDPSKDYAFLYDISDKSSGEGPAQIRFFSPSKMVEVTPGGAIEGTTSALLFTTWLLEARE
jgi:hypothetical protein